jgi:riboflavin kinase/FMN adenylyltransferase
VHFLHKLRDEMKFVDLPQLQQQIAVDVIAARTWFGDVGP